MTPGSNPVSATTVAVAVVSLSLLQFVDVLSNTVVVTVLPQMLADVRAQPAASSLVATGYAMLFGGLLMFASRVGDRIGHRRAVLVSLAIFSLGAAVAGLATSVAMLAIGRGLQGAGAALAVPSALSILTKLSTDPTRRNRAIAVWSAAGAAGGAGGFVIGGVVSGLATWRWIFAGMIAVAAVLTVMILVTVPPDTDRQTRLPLNAPSSLLLTGAVIAAVIATTILPSARYRPIGLALLVVTTGLLLTLRTTDPRSRAPLLPAAVTRHPLLRRGVLGSLINTATTSSAVTVLTLYLQNTLHHGPLLTAALLVPFSLAVIAGSAAAPAAINLLQREGAVAVGHGLIAVGLLLLTVAPNGYASVGSSMALTGAGIGIASVPATSLGTDVPDLQRATASGLVNTGTQLGTAIGTAALLLITATTTGIPDSTNPAPRPAWTAAAAFAALGTVMFTTLRRTNRSAR